MSFKIVLSTHLWFMVILKFDVILITVNVITLIKCLKQDLESRDQALEPTGSGLERLNEYFLRKYHLKKSILQNILSSFFPRIFRRSMWNTRFWGLHTCEFTFPIFVWQLLFYVWLYSILLSLPSKVKVIATGFGKLCTGSGKWISEIYVQKLLVKYSLNARKSDGEIESNMLLQ